MNVVAASHVVDFLFESRWLLFVLPLETSSSGLKLSKIDKRIKKTFFSSISPFGFEEENPKVDYSSSLRNTRARCPEQT
jgi:hypothetical protein